MERHAPKWLLNVSCVTIFIFIVTTYLVIKQYFDFRMFTELVAYYYVTLRCKILATT